MNYLSQTTIPYAVALNAKLIDGYAWHNAVWGSFPGKPDNNREFLFRVDKRQDWCRVLLLSMDEPSSTDILAWRIRKIASDFLEHDVYRFQLKANPTMRRSADRRRLAIYDDARLREWLDRKACDSGFEIDADSLDVGTPIDEAFVKNGRRGKHAAVDFSGVLHVTDRTLFSNAFHNGIGSAKGFGYGMLMLQPLSSNTSPD